MNSLFQKLIALFVFIYLNTVNGQNAGDLKFNVNFGQVNALLKNAVPLLPFLLVGKTITGPLNINTNLQGVPIIGQFSNLSLLQLNAQSIQANPQVSTNGLQLNLTNVNITLKFNYNLTGLISDSGLGNLTIQNFNFSLTLNGNQNSSAQTNQTIFISQVYLNYSNFTLQLHLPAIANIINNMFKNPSQLNQLINDQVKNGLNSTLINLTSQYQYLEFGNYNYSIQLNAKYGPGYQKSTYDNSSYNFIAGLDLKIMNNQTKQSSVMPQRGIQFDSINTKRNDLQIILGSNIINQLLFLLQDSQFLSLVLDSKSLPASLPITLNTSGIQILLPQITNKYGKNKGMYVKVNLGTPYNSGKFTDGRILLQLSVLLDFIVDVNSTNYPSSYNCLTCQSALQLNTSLFVQLRVNTSDPQFVQATVQDLEIFKLSVANSTVDVDANGLQQLLNNVLSSFIPIINSQLIIETKSISQLIPIAVAGLQLNEVLVGQGLDNLYLILGINSQLKLNQKQQIKRIYEKYNQQQ